MANEYIKQDSSIPNTWSGLLTSWNDGLRDIGNPANAFKVEKALPEPGLIDVSGMFSPGIINQSVRAGLKSTGLGLKNMSNAERIVARNNWHKNADPMLKNTDGTAKTFYIGSPRNNKTEFGIRSNPVNMKAADGEKLRPYQRRGDTFATDDPIFAQDFYTRNSSAISDMSKLPKGEGNIYPVNINTNKMFNPNNENQMNELIRHVNAKEKAGINTAIDSTRKKNSYYSSPLSHSIGKIQNINDGWKIAEKQATLDALSELGYGGQFVNESSKLSPSVFNPENIKSIFNSGKYGNTRDILNSGLGLGLIGGASSQSK